MILLQTYIIMLSALDNSKHNYSNRASPTSNVKLLPFYCTYVLDKAEGGWMVAPLVGVFDLYR
jgi:hypothetical protein